jgi:hypothetical protein
VDREDENAEKHPETAGFYGRKDVMVNLPLILGKNSKFLV